MYNLDRIEECQGMTVNEFANFFPQGVYIIRVDGHCTCVIDNQLFDIWNCGNEIVDIAWKVK